ncbi:MAG: hypothetical protein MR654_06850, partial [Corynebacterium glucuronolyticum]|nr:hypothetical protein [Corynebacterium glucuronolyticum]
DPKQGFVDATNHAINSYNTTLAIANGENPQNRTPIAGTIQNVFLDKFLYTIPRGTLNLADEAHGCRFGSPGTGRTRKGDVFYSVAIWKQYINHGHNGIFVEDWKGVGLGVPTIEAVNAEEGVRRLDPNNRKGVCKPILLRVRTEEQVRERAVAFAASKDKKASYNSNFLITRLMPLNTNTYNCSQLVWAAYRIASNETIDIGTLYPGQQVGYAVYPADILLSYRTWEYDRQDFR